MRPSRLALALAALLAVPAWGARSFNGTTQYLVHNAGPNVTRPMTYAAMFNPAALDVNYTVLSTGQAASNDHFVRLSLAGTTNRVAAGSADTSAVVAATSTTAYSAGAWQHGTAVFNSATDRRAFLEGGSKGTNATSRNPAAPDRTTIGVTHRLTLLNFLNGSVAFAAMWDVALTDDEVAILGKRFDPRLVRPDQLRHYWPLIRDADIDIVGGKNMTPTASPGVSTNPRIFMAD